MSDYGFNMIRTSKITYEKNNWYCTPDNHSGLLLQILGCFWSFIIFEEHSQFLSIVSMLNCLTNFLTLRNGSYASSNLFYFVVSIWDSINLILAIKSLKAIAYLGWISRRQLFSRKELSDEKPSKDPVNSLWCIKWSSKLFGQASMKNILVNWRHHVYGFRNRSKITESRWSNIRNTNLSQFDVF